MPGLTGFTSNADRRRCRRVLDAMRDAVAHEPAHRHDDRFGACGVYATRTHLGPIRPETQPVWRAGRLVWMDGEIYNRPALVRKHDLDVRNDLELLAALIDLEPGFRALREIDGFYAAVIFDERDRKLHLLSDRCGLRHLYWTPTRDGIAWSSEVKALLECPGVNMRLDRNATQQFLEIGYMLHDRTWFEDVKLLETGCVLSCDLESGAIERTRYWWWDDIEPRNETAVTDDLIDELGHLFEDAVRRRWHADERIGLTLSGGLDSRAILATLPDGDHPLNAVTFGRPDCTEVHIAAMAARKRGAAHHVAAIDRDNWLDNRAAGVWWTDGMLDLQHMHGIESRDLIRDLFDINMNGYSGDLILGGSYLGGFEDTRAGDRRRLTAESMDCDPALLEGYDECAAHRSTDIYYLQNRVRRFTYGGTRHFLTSIAYRKPFFDRALIDFAYALPDDLRRQGRLYHAMLLRKFPAYFLAIPYQATGATLDASKLHRRTIRFLRQARRALNRVIEPLGIHVGRSIGATNYPLWLRREPARSMAIATLTADDAVYPDFIPRENVTETLQAHLRGGDRTRMLSRYLTFELWLQQAFRGRFRTEFTNPAPCGALRKAA